MKKVLALVLALAMLTAVLAGCGASSAASAEASGSAAASTDVASAAAAAKDDGTPAYGGGLTIYLNTLQTEYDPSAPDFMNYMLWYERLFCLDWTNTTSKFDNLDESTMTGQIADTWEWDAAAKTFTVNIRSDINFQTLDAQYDYYGGRNLTAEDVKWTYDRLLGIGSGYTEPIPTMLDWTATLYMLESVETAGDYTVVFHFNTDSELAVNDFMVGAVNIAGPEWDQLTPEQQTDWHYCCGTGPFMISSYDEGGSNLILTRNPNYYDYDERYPENQLPYLDTVTFVKIEDTATLMAEFIAGDLDIVANQWAIFSDSEEQQIQDSMDASKYVFWDLPTNSVALCMKQCIEPLQSLEVRKALQYAINIEEIATQYYGKTDWVMPSLFDRDSKYCGYDQWSDELKAEYLTYDPEKAKELLAEAGYPDGFEFNMTYVNSGDTTDIYLLVQQYLAQVGVTMNIVAANDHASYVNDATGMDTPYCGVGALGITSTMMIGQTYRSGGPEYMFGGEDELDAMVDKCSAATTVAEQTEAYKALERYVGEQHLVFAISPALTMHYVTSSKIGGYDGQSLSSSHNYGTILARVWDKTTK